MEKINKKITKKCNICYQAGIVEGIQQEQKRILEIINKEILNTNYFIKGVFNEERTNIIIDSLEELKQQIQEDKKQ